MTKNKNKRETEKVKVFSMGANIFDSYSQRLSILQVRKGMHRPEEKHTRENPESDSIATFPQLAIPQIPANPSSFSHTYVWKNMMYTMCEITTYYSAD